MRSDLKRGIAALAVLLVCAGALAAPYSWRTPKGWRTEVFALPPSFASVTEKQPSTAGAAKSAAKTKIAYPSPRWRRIFWSV